VEFFKNSNYNFVKYGRVAFIISMILVVASVLAVFLITPRLSVEFTGGVKVIVKLAEPIKIGQMDELRNITDAEINTMGMAGDSITVQEKGSAQAGTIAADIIKERDLAAFSSVDDLFARVKSINALPRDEVKLRLTTTTEATDKTSKTAGRAQLVGTVNVNTDDEGRIRNALDNLVAKQTEASIRASLSKVFGDNSIKDGTDLNTVNYYDELVTAFSDTLGDQRAAMRLATAVMEQRGLSAGGLAETRLVSDLDKLAEKAQLTPDQTVRFKAKFYVNPYIIQGTSLISSRVSGPTAANSLLAMFFATLGILVYIWIRFDLRIAISGVAALVHDAFIAAGACMLMQFEFGLTMIAAFLTLLGYSIYDSVVTFDRIREVMGQHRRESYDDVINRSINENLSRTVLTGFCSILILFSLFLLGGEALAGFSFALIIGTITGMYSSVFIAAPILVEWMKLKPKKAK
jgi:preprotein translocase SecF subunit